MEDAERAIKRVRDELAVKDKANGTSVAESLDLADLVTEMTQIKHPFREGVKAQPGIEF